MAAVAAIERAVELTTAYVKERQAFGKTLIEMQNTRFKLAECKTTAHIARVFVDDCIRRLMRRHDGRDDRVDGQVVDDRACSARSSTSACSSSAATAT